MADKIKPQSYIDYPMTGVGLLSGFGAPDNPPEYRLDKKNNEAIPKSDTHPGPGTVATRKGKPVPPDKLLGEDD